MTPSEKELRERLTDFLIEHRVFSPSDVDDYKKYVTSGILDLINQEKRELLESLRMYKTGYIQAMQSKRTLTESHVYDQAVDMFNAKLDQERKRLEEQSEKGS